MKTRRKSNPYTAIILLCWLTYTTAYVGKLSYSASINQIISEYGVSHADAGLVSTLLFFAYAIGQLINGVLCKKYNLRIVIPIALFVSGAANLLIAATSIFSIIKFAWLINGFALSFLWPSIIRLLSESISKESMPKASILLGTTVTLGTFTVYLLSAMFTKISYRLTFYTAAIILPTVALIWYLRYNKYRDRALSALPTLENEPSVLCENDKKAKSKIPFDILVTAIALGIIGIGVNLVADGLTTWVPSILKEGFGFDDSISLILTLALPLVAMLGSFIAVGMHKRIPAFVSQAALSFLVSGLLILTVIKAFEIKTAAIAIVCFALTRTLIASVNNLITSIFPLYMKGKINSGMFAGLINCACYIGSTLSSYVLGDVADKHGWETVFWVLFFVCAIVILIWAVHLIITKLHNGKTRRV